MKRVLITGAGSYVGGWVRKRLEQEPERFYVEELDVQDDAWKSFDFSGFDSVFHVAGIAHVSTDPSMEGLYYQVNRDLAVEVGKRAKAAGVRQLVFMSSSIVYGDSSSRDEGPITRETPANPANFYGRSKLEAEEGLHRLADDQFNVAILRCPMIYGPGCKGNFPTLAKIARKLPVFLRCATRGLFCTSRTSLSLLPRLLIEGSLECSGLKTLTTCPPLRRCAYLEKRRAVLFM